MNPANERGGLVIGRITDHLISGGMFNPELADHDAVRELLIDSREAIHCLVRMVNALEKLRNATPAVQIYMPGSDGGVA